MSFITTMILIVIFVCFNAFIILISPVLWLYHNILRNSHILFSFSLLLYPLCLFTISHLLRKYGSELYTADFYAQFSSRHSHPLSVDGGFYYSLSGYLLLILTLCITFVILILIGLRLMKFIFKESH